MLRQALGLPMGLYVGIGLGLHKVDIRIVYKDG